MLLYLLIVGKKNYILQQNIHHIKFILFHLKKKRIPGCKVTPHYCKIQDFDESFYRQFHAIVCGLDSIVARRWINGMILSLLNYEEDGMNYS